MTKIKGELEIYHEDFNLLAFSNGIDSSSAVILISGMNGNILSPNYFFDIMNFLTDRNVLCIAPQLRSYPHYGLYTLDDDVEDITRLINYFKLEKVVLVGHSTGCQVSMHFIEKEPKVKVEMIFLQAPVSDRQAMEYSPDKYISLREEAKRCLFNIMPSVSIPMTGTRFLDLYEIGGKDDYFSSDLPLSKFQALNKTQSKIVAVLSKYDEYQPISNKEQLMAIPNIEIYAIEADHSCSLKKYKEELMEVFMKCFNSLDLK